MQKNVQNAKSMRTDFEFLTKTTKNLREIPVRRSFARKMLSAVSER